MLRKARTTALLWIFCAAAASADWDVTDTGQPYTEAKFTVTEGTWMSVDVSRDGQTLVFDLLGDIYSIPAGGGEATLIHGGPAIEHSPRFSPDGTKILYISDRGGSDNVWSSNADGSAARQITRETVNTLGSPAWDAQGQYVSATRFSPEVSKFLAAEIWLYHLDGGQGRLLVEAPKGHNVVHEPLFSRDGRYVYYTENIFSTSPINPNQPLYAIKRRDLGDGKVEEVVSGFGSATTAQLSPDDGQMAFIRRVKDKTVLFVYDMRGGEQRPVYDGLDRDLHGNWNPRAGSYYPQYGWFPDSRHLAIWGKGKLYKIDTRTQAREEIPFRVTAKHRITVPARFENPLAPERFTVRAIHQIAPSPDGKSVAFYALGHLWQKTLPDGKPQRLTTASAFEFEPSYSSDGVHLVYVSWNDERGGALEIMDVKSRQVRTLLQGSAIIRQPAFSPDGKTVAYWVEGGARKIGGYRGKAGLYWTSVANGQPHFVAPAGRNPRFSPDGKRIYYVVSTPAAFGGRIDRILESVDLNGLDRRQHVVGEEVDELRISPDSRWLGYKKELQYYVIPYRETGAPMKLTRTSEEMPIVRLTEQGGFELTWSADSRRLHWVLGSSLFSASIERRLSAGAKPKIVETAFDLQAVPDKPQGIVAFTNGRIITMAEPVAPAIEVIERGSVVIEGNRITALGPVDRVSIPKAAKVIDISGKTLMPGFVDMHGHLESSDSDFLLPQKHPNHYAALAFGITTNLDPASRPPSLATSELNLAGVAVGPRLITTGAIVFGIDAVTAVHRLHPINGLDDARNIVAHKKALGAIIVKSYMQPMRSQRQQLIKAAREAEVMVTPEGEGHYYNNLSMILDGHVSVEHNFPMANYYDDVIQLIVHGGTSVTPTLIVANGETPSESYFYQTTRPWDDPKIKIYVQRTYGRGLEMPPYVKGMVTLHQAEELWDIGFRSVARSLKKLDDAGGVVNTGGHGQIHGLDLHWELWSLAEGGMSNQRILRAATSNGARTIGLDKQIGTVEAGKLADLIVLDANPLENIRNTNTVRYTMVNGRLYDSLSMNEIGNYNRPRSRFYWELEDYKGIDWNEAWGGPGVHEEVPIN